MTTISLVLLGALLPQVAANCIANSTINNEFPGAVNLADDSCCMDAVCGLACPVPVPGPAKGYGIAVMLSVVLSFLVGVATLFLVHGKSENYFVAGRSLPLWIVSITLAAQSVDSNALLGNVDLSYKYSFYDGAVIPIGLGLSLIINGIFLAHHVNNDGAFTLPDIFGKRYGPVVEVLASLCTIVSFLMLLAGNLVGFGRITHYLWDLSEEAAVWIAAGIVFSYTVCGGLFSVAYTDVVQGIIGWSGCLVLAFYLIATEDPNAPPPSIGFPDYIYPDNIGDGGVCDMYNGTACTVNTDKCCYNQDLWCDDSGDNCRYDRAAYPTGDQRVFSDQMTYFRALSPFPNAIFWNWCTIFILAFGNLAALDFQARCMASKTPRTARLGCLIGGCFTFLIGIPFAYLGAISRVYYGPDSIHSVFEADSCAIQLGLPTCALWVPDEIAFLRLATHQAPAFLGGWCLIGIIAASMSTADGAILAMGTVAAHNIVRQFDACFPKIVTPDNLLTVARVTSLPFTIISACIAAYYKSSSSAAGATGYLLIVAFDIVLATCVVPLFGAFYTKVPSPRAALVSLIGGAATRVTLEFVLPKDGLLLLPYEVDEFLNVGPAASTLYPEFIDVNATEHWDPVTEPCVQDYYKDFTGADSLAALTASFLLFVSIQFLEYRLGRPLFEFAGSKGYIKDVQKEALEAELVKEDDGPAEVPPDQQEEAGDVVIKEDEESDEMDA